MATPLGHYLFGLSIAGLAARDDRERRQAPWWATIACAPDLDLLPGIAVGHMGLYHHGISHSLGAAALVALGGAAVLAYLRRRVPLRIPLLVFALYASHIGLDAVTEDPSPPVGVPMFWPLSAETFQSPWTLLPRVQHSTAPVVSLHNALLMVRETLIFTPLVGLVFAARLSLRPWRNRLVWTCGVGFVVAAGLSVLSLSRG